ncbi:MAG: malonyl-CoA synthase [Proteobacteria bacterium]|nr:MAG: malonyl-CoA synthase [Pseudomonadota bacterium]
MSENDNLYAVLRGAFPSDTEACCMELPDGSRLSYADIDTGSGRMAGMLRDLGVGRGDRVLVQVEKSPQAVLLYLGCLRAGAVFLPLNTAYKAREVEYFMGDATPRLAVCRPGDAAAFERLSAAGGGTRIETLGDGGDGSLMSRYADAPSDDMLAECARDDLAAILYTSGTTGRSKGAMLSHGNLSSNARVLHQLWGFGDGDVLIHALPIFHVHGLFIALHCSLLNGTPMIFQPRFDADAVIDAMPRATVLMGVPTFYVRLLDNPRFDRDSTRNMRLFVAGSAPLLPETFAAFETRTGHRILERYGMTEAGMITSNPLHGERVPGTVGYLLPGVSGRVADGDGNELPRGEVGVLEITGPNVFKGYWQMPEKTAGEFRDDGYFITGDNASMAEDGRISIVGRARDLVISGGYNVYPKEVELLIDVLPGVRESAVIGVPHPDFGEGVVAVVATDDPVTLDETAVIGALSNDLAAFKRPKRVFFTRELPRNTMGKVQKNRLREQYADAFSG